jgi:glycine hydroxymethyltransferase
MKQLIEQDPEIAGLIEKETRRQQDGLTLIPSENHTSAAVLEALSTVLSDKYAEGYPGRRYYSGNEVVDQLETLVQERAKRLFGVPYVNVQPYSGSPANFAVYLATMEPGQAFMGLDLPDGGHLSHGWKANATSRLWKSVPYHVTDEGRIDLDKLRTTAKLELPKLIWCGGTALPRAIPFKEMAEIADEVGALLVADISHIAGLVAGGAHESPVPYAHIVTTTTHKTLRGPRGAMIMVTQKGIDRDADFPTKIDKAIIPGFQGGPHMNTIAGIGVALQEASQPSFRDYATNVVLNAKTMAEALTQAGFTLVSGGTDNHLILVDLTPSGIGRGTIFQNGLEQLGLYTNKNAVPGDQSSAFYPSGLRLGTPAVTTRGMMPSDMKQIASWIAQFSEHAKNVQVPSDKEARQAAIKAFNMSLQTDSFYATLREDVRTLSRRYPIPGV